MALLHSVSYFFFLYPSASSTSNINFHQFPLSLNIKFLYNLLDAISSNIDEVLLIKLSVNVFVSVDFNAQHKDWPTYSGGTDRSCKLCYNFSILNDFTQMVNFPTPRSPALLVYFFLLILLFDLQWLPLQWDIMIMLLSQFPLTFHQTQKGMRRFIT